MPWSYRFDEGTIMVGWRPEILKTRTPEEREAAYHNRWYTFPPLGENACPEEVLRRELVILDRRGNPAAQGGRTSFPKCTSCRMQHAPIENHDHQNGSKNLDYVPCGCLWKHAAVERLAIKLGYINPAKNHDLNPNDLRKSSRAVMWDIIENACGFLPGTASVLARPKLGQPTASGRKLIKIRISSDTLEYHEEHRKTGSDGAKRGKIEMKGGDPWKIL